MKTLALFSVVAAALPLAAATCESLATLKLAKATITKAESVAANAFRPPVGAPAAAQSSSIQNVPAFCRVVMVLKPSSDSDIQMEVWMPSTGWNGNFQGIGNGGFAGSISVAGMVAAVSHGYATASTDTGHQAGGTDASWALNHPEKAADFGYRAIHETAEKAKEVIRAFYGGAPKRSYFSSCSNGGRQALMEAQRYPADYDGIIAGAPANHWTHLLTAAVFDIQATTADPASYIPASKLPAIQAAALDSCDGIDAVKDGVIEDPTQCRFDPSRLLCKGADNDACLTGPQLAALKSIYEGPKDSKGISINPGFSPGGEAEPGGWAAWITGTEPRKSAQFAFGNNFFQNIVYSDPAWDYKTSNPEHNAKVADDRVASIFNATDPNLKKFKDRGGKLILYHGWSDAAIPALSTIDYYQSVQKKMGGRDTGQFVRLFMVPGMQHCGNGSGPNTFGQATVGYGEPDHDIDAALERWVEQGTAPEQIIATKYKANGNLESGVARTRPLCAYPKTAHYRGSGSTDEASSFICK